MGDAICRKCGEPWELYYLRHEALWDYPGDDAPEDIHDYHARLVSEDERLYEESGRHPDAPSAKIPSLWGERFQTAVLRGEGCPACWEDPSRVHDNEDASIDALRHNLFDSTWDGDPAELL